MATARAMVDRATSDLLIGPDWAMNLEICDILNHDPGQAKDAVRGLRKRLGSRNPKVQLLALTLLETLIKNCSDIVHMHVAEKNILAKMVKIAKKKKPDAHVKEKILALIDTWQEAFGGPQARHLHYYVAYQDLMRAGAMFPKRSQQSAVPVFASRTQVPQSTVSGQGETESSNADSLPPLSLVDMQNARGIMDVLSEMLNAVDPLKKEAVQEEVIVDLVGQCRSYKLRVLDLVNSTVINEELLSKGLALNDDLEKLLAMHDSIASGKVSHADKRKTLQLLVDIDDANRNTLSQQDERSQSRSNGQSPFEQLLLPAPATSNGTATFSDQIGSNVDLLSGEGFSTQTTQSSHVFDNSATEPNMLALSDMLSENSVRASPKSLTSPFDPPLAYQTSQATPDQPQLHMHSVPHSSGSLPGSGETEHPAAHTPEEQIHRGSLQWNGHATQGLNSQPQAFAYNENGHGDLPPPPWEAPVESSQPLGSQYLQSQNGHLEGINHLGGYPASMQNQLGGVYPQPIHAIQGSQLIGYPYTQQPGMEFYNQTPAYPHANPNEVYQRMYGLSMQGGTSMSMNPLHQKPMSSSSTLQSIKPSKPEDKLFGDLVSMAKAK